MAKIMLVEDDNNLRQIYEDRLVAEGHTIVSAGDGEEALALAIKERPDLIIADIMMPRVSGFDMLDILRQTPETKDTKIIMMTALSQAEDRTHAEKLGADRYLVKSQVTLEDVTKVANEMLQMDNKAADATAAKAENSGTAPAPAPEPPKAAPAVPSPMPAPAPAAPEPTPAPTSPAPAAKSIPVNVASDDDSSAPATTSEPTTSPEPAPEPPVQDDSSTPMTPPQDPDPAPKSAPAVDTPTLDNFIANNSSAATPTPSDNSLQDEETKGSESQNNEASGSGTPTPSDKLDDAVEDLLKEQSESPTNDNNGPTAAEEKPNQTDAEGQRISVTHGKKLQPISDDLTKNGPDINELLAKESAAGTTPPAVSTVISPNGSASPAPSVATESTNDSPISPDTMISPDIKPQTPPAN